MKCRKNLSENLTYIWWHLFHSYWIPKLTCYVRKMLNLGPSWSSEQSTQENFIKAWPWIILVEAQYALPPMLPKILLLSYHLVLQTFFNFLQGGLIKKTLLWIHTIKVISTTGWLLIDMLKKSFLIIWTYVLSYSWLLFMY